MCHSGVAFSLCSEMVHVDLQRAVICDGTYLHQLSHRLIRSKWRVKAAQYRDDKSERKQVTL